MVQQWLQRLGLTVARSDAVPAPSKTKHISLLPPSWLDRITPRAPDDGVTYPTPMTKAEIAAACDWLNNRRGWRRLR